MKLAAYKRQHRLTYERLAKLLAMTKTSAWRYCQGEVPSAAAANRISRATNGEVTVEELLYPTGVSPGARMTPRDPMPELEDDEQLEDDAADNPAAPGTNPCGHPSTLVRGGVTNYCSGCESDAREMDASGGADAAAA
ncbi:MAG: hypothetical protein Q8R92_20975 [Deltaproteobacteria bacterium]|nr:hypothetical protein [Deltaproteobacteria bacterium]